MFRFVWLFLSFGFFVLVVEQLSKISIFWDHAHIDHVHQSFFANYHLVDGCWQGPRIMPGLCRQNYAWLDQLPQMQFAPRTRHLRQSSS